MNTRRKKPGLHVVTPGDGDPSGARPVVQIIAGKRSEAIDEAETYLVDRDPDLFQRGAFVVRVAPEEVEVGAGQKASALRIVKVGNEHMRERLSQAVDFRSFDKRAEAFLPRDTPKDLAAAYLEREGLWKLPVLTAVATAPTLRPDGSIIDEPGFDPATGVYYDPRGISFPTVPRAPTKAAALAALDRLETLLATFDFVDEASRSTALSGLMTPLVRPAISVAPLHSYSAPVAGSGKSKLVDLASILASGHPAPVMAQGQRDEETEKALKTALLAGDLISSMDNVERPVGGDLLNQICTQSLITVRLFQTLTSQRVVNRVCMFGTGNNLQLLGDLTRRALVCRLDPQCERPELREFESGDPCAIALRDRAEFVVAVLTIVRAFVLEGRPCSTPPIGSYEGWSRWVRDPLIWLGRIDPAETMELARGSDPRLAALRTILAQWSWHLGDIRFTAQEVIARASERSSEHGRASERDNYRYPEFRDALLVAAGERGAINSRRFGKWLANSAGRRVAVDIGGQQATRLLSRDGSRSGVTLWKVTPC